MDEKQYRVGRDDVLLRNDSSGVLGSIKSENRYWTKESQNAGCQAIFSFSLTRKFIHLDEKETIAKIIHFFVLFHR